MVGRQRASKCRRGDFADYVIGLRHKAAGGEITLTFDRTLKKGDLFTTA
jgi:predicted nucleic-acid-binding protein